MDVAAAFAKTAVKLAGDICGVPGIPILADAIVTLIETCESIPKQKQVHWTRLISEPAYTLSRQNVKDLRRRCMTLLDVLRVEASNGPPTSERLEKAIIDANE